MKMSNAAVIVASGFLTPLAMAFLRNSIQVMLPWTMAFVAVVMADLAAGIYKSKRMGVEVRTSKAWRETMGKIIVYFAFVLAVAMVDVASGGGMGIAKFCCLFICGIEGCSIVSNLLKPHGISVSLYGIIKTLLKRTPLGVTDEEAEEIIKKNAKKTNGVKKEKSPD